MIRDEEARNMTWSSYSLYSSKEVSLGAVIITSMLITQLFHPVSICCTQIFPDDLFCDIPTDVLSIVTGFLALYFLLFWLEDFGTEVLVVIRWMVGEDEWPFSIGRRSYQFSKDGVIGLLPR